MYIQFLLVMSAFRISKWSFQTRSQRQPLGSIVMPWTYIGGHTVLLRRSSEGVPKVFRRTSEGVPKDAHCVFGPYSNKMADFHEIVSETALLLRAASLSCL